MILVEGENGGILMITEENNGVLNQLWCDRLFCEYPDKMRKAIWPIDGPEIFSRAGKFCQQRGLFLGLSPALFFPTSMLP